MYELSLIPKNNPNKFSNQTVYWYPIKVEGKRLLSMNISRLTDFRSVIGEWDNNRIIYEYPLNKYNVCFFYLGSMGNVKVISAFREKPLLIQDKKINYIFSELELKDISCRINGEPISKYRPSVSENKMLKTFEQTFSDEWDVSFHKIGNVCPYCTEQISPHPILHLVRFTRPDLFGKKYYRSFLEFVLKNGFLVEWNNPEEIDTNLLKYIVSQCSEISDGEIKRKQDLKKVMETTISELFGKYEIFRLTYQATRCGSNNSILKILMDNLTDLLPAKDQEGIKKDYIYFQPKILVYSVTIDFILSTASKFQIESLYHSLSKISKRVIFHDLLQYKKLEIEDEILKNLRHFKPENRYRFRCEIDFPPVDYLVLADKIFEISNAIKTVLFTKEIDNNLREMWVKKIDTLIFTPPQFEEHIANSLAEIFFITYNNDKNMEDLNEKTRIIFITLSCDYRIFNEKSFAFSYEYGSDMQSVYSILNEKMEQLYNYTQLSNF